MVGFHTTLPCGWGTGTPMEMKLGHVCELEGSSPAVSSRDEAGGALSPP